MDTNTLLINLYAGPGTGKSSTMAGVFSELKWRGVNCEMAPEFAKEKVWEGSLGILQNQIYVFGKQLHAIHRVMGKVDVVITDSPLLLSLIYGKDQGDAFKNLVLDVYKRYNTLNIFLKRHKAYNPAGRLQTEEKAKKIDQDLLDLLSEYELPFVTYDSGRECINPICDRAITIIGNDRQLYKWKDDNEGISKYR